MIANSIAPCRITETARPAGVSGAMIENSTARIVSASTTP